MNYVVKFKCIKEEILEKSVKQICSSIISDLGVTSVNSDIALACLIYFYFALYKTL